MDEVIDQLLQFIAQVQKNFDDLSDEEANEIANFLNSSLEVLQELQQRPPGPSPQQIPEGAELLWILSGGQEDAFVNYLRTYPSPELNEILRNPNYLAHIIEILKKTRPQGEQPTKDGIPHADLNSSNIYGFKYDPRSGRLLVRFQSGSVYGYNGVPSGVFKVFQQGAVPANTTGSNEHGQWWRGKIPSLGAAFYQMIRNGGYPYQRLS